MVKKSTRPHPKTTESEWSKFWKNFWDGKKPEENIDNLITGHFNANTKRALTLRINKIIENSASIKIGKTGDTYVRGEYADYRGQYKQMHVLYCTSSEKYVSLAEEYCINKFLESHPNKVDNKTGKRTGKMFSYNGYHYMYVVSR